jgi:hypothetical protein
MSLSKKSRSRKRDHNKEVKTASLSQALDPSPKTQLDILAEKRTGGSDAIQGFSFQFNYAVYKVLFHLTLDDMSDVEFIRLEGIEDIDVAFKLSTSKSSEFIQVKYSKNDIDAGNFWEKGILQNFAKAYIIDNQSRFRLVYNMNFAKGHLSDLADALKKHTIPSFSDLEFWRKKFDDFKNQDKAKEWNWAAFDLADFITRITFERQSESFLTDEAHRLLISNHNITSGNEQLYVDAIFSLVIDKSRQKQKIKRKDLISSIESVKADISRGPTNLAAQGGWLDYVNFDAGIEAESSSSYFEGKAARPKHIAAGLPVRRKKWEEEIREKFQESDVIVIKASSGQGKSTLAWQVAFSLQGDNWAPYELLWCGDEKLVGNIVTLIESQIKVGKLPLIVIDGLRREVSAWYRLAKQTQDLPVKYIVTTREEDWYRFGADASQLRLRMINIDMTKEEAEKIFRQFKNAGKIHPSVRSWQSAWEKVADRGLLIEYVYLLTQGEMIEERLSHQIAHLGAEPDGKSKLEILRLAAVADLCGVRLTTSSLIDSIESRIGFVGDRGQCLKSLQEEYYIQVEGREYVEGLHPIRSEHISNLLHQALPLQETLLDLLPLIDADAVSDFSAYAPLLVEGKQRILLLNKLAEYISNKSYPDIVNVIDGLFSTDALQHWKENQSIYDYFFAHGMGMFIIYAFPWSGLDLNGFAVGGLKPAIDSLSDEITKINKTIDPKKFDTFIFIQALSNALAESEFTDDLSGLGRLAFWFSLFDVDCPLFLNINEKQLCEAFQLLELEDAGELFTACYKIRPDIYEAFFNEHRSEIVGMLKIRTNTLTILQNNSDLLIEYFIDFESNTSINEQSVSRISSILPFLHPQYETYSTQGLYPAVQGLDTHIALDESKKHIALRNLHLSFRIRVNRIWKNRIDANYESPSVYEWQKQWYTIRRKSRELAIEYANLFEAILKGSKPRLNSSANKIKRLHSAIVSYLDSVKEFPTRNNKEFDSDKVKNELQAIAEWASSWRSFIDQQSPSNQNQNSYLNQLKFKIQDAYRKLESMQDAYDKIATATFSYFDVSLLKNQERKAYGYLPKVINFFVCESAKIGKIVAPRSAVDEWWNQLDKKRIEGINEVLTDLEKDTDIECIRPTYTVEHDLVREAAIGLKGIRSQQLDEVLFKVMYGLGSEQLDDVLLKPLIRCLRDLADIEVDQYSLLFVDDGNHSQRPFAILLTKNCLHHVKEYAGTAEEFEWNDYDRPRLVALKEDVLKSVPEISTAKTDESFLSITEIMVNLWRITEVRQRLSPNVKVESTWSKELEENYYSELRNSLANLKANASQETWEGYRNLAAAVVNGGESLTVGLLARYVAHIQGN